MGGEQARGGQRSKGKDTLRPSSTEGVLSQYMRALLLLPHEGHQLAERWEETYRYSVRGYFESWQIGWKGRGCQARGTIWLLLQLRELAFHQLPPGVENLVLACEQPLQVLAVLLGVPLDLAQLN